MKTLLSLIAVICLGLLSSIMINQAYAGAKESSQLFSSDELIELVIKTDLKALMRDVGEKREYHDAVLLYNENGQPISINVKIKTRGHFRRQRSTCKFPPLKINFPRQGVENTIFKGLNKLKLVTHCNQQDIYETNMLNEYLIYKMYNIISDRSFKVRLVKIKYFDTQGKIEPIEKYSFFIEDDYDMAQRLGGQLLEVKNIHPDRTDFDQMTLMSVFQFMIGNTDWSVPALHNIALVNFNSQQPPVAIPFDFDWTGFVNAPYAKPNENLPIENVTDRLYRGFYRTEDQLKNTFTILKEHKDEIMQLILNFSYLNEKAIEKNLKYVNDFFNLIENEEFVKKEFIINCRGTSKQADS